MCWDDDAAAALVHAARAMSAQINQRHPAPNVIACQQSGAARPLRYLSRAHVVALVQDAPTTSTRALQVTHVHHCQSRLGPP
jgi:hypothetical protein